MKKKLISQEILNLKSDVPITFKEITIKLDPDDVIHAGFDEGFYSDNESWDSHYFFKVIRDRLETDEEFEKRKEREKSQKEYLKKQRHESYLRLKKEFENE